MKGHSEFRGNNKQFAEKEVTHNCSPNHMAFYVCMGGPRLHLDSNSEETTPPNCKKVLYTGGAGEPVNKGGPDLGLIMPLIAMASNLTIAMAQPTGDGLHPKSCLERSGSGWSSPDGWGS